MTWCLTAPSHYLNQCWLLNSEIPWYSHESPFTANAQSTRLCNEFENCTLKNRHVSQGQWFNDSRIYRFINFSQLTYRGTKRYHHWYWRSSPWYLIITSFMNSFKMLLNIKIYLRQYITCIFVMVEKIKTILFLNWLLIQHYITSYSSVYFSILLESVVLSIHILFNLYLLIYSLLSSMYSCQFVSHWIIRINHLLFGHTVSLSMAKTTGNYSYFKAISL